MNGVASPGLASPRPLGFDRLSRRRGLPRFNSPFRRVVSAAESMSFVPRRPLSAECRARVKAAPPTVCCLGFGKHRDIPPRQTTLAPRASLLSFPTIGAASMAARGPKHPLAFYSSLWRRRRRRNHGCLRLSTTAPRRRRRRSAEPCEPCDARWACFISLCFVLVFLFLCVLLFRNQVKPTLV